MEQLSGRVAVVTGAASGIGLALAERLADEGMRLVLADIEPQALERAAAALRGRGAEVLAQATDVAVAAQVQALADAAWARFGAVHLLCNNAGVLTPGLAAPGWLSSLADWQWVLSVNLMGVVHGMHAFVPRMLAAGEEGHVVNTASVAGLMTASNPYHVSKHGVTCLTEGLYKDFRRAGARLSASVLCPGLITTRILEAERNRPDAATDTAAWPEAARQAAANFRSMLETGYPPAQVADAVVSAVRADRFYVLPAQLPLQQMVDLRMADITARRNPTLPPPLQLD